MRFTLWSTRSARVLSLLVGVACLFAAPQALAQTIFVGPTPYLSSADTPPLFYATGVATALEDFEDCSKDFGITGTSGDAIKNTFDPNGCLQVTISQVDSVDPNGVSYFRGSPHEFVFASPVTAAGLVYTDGVGPFEFEAFAPGGASLGVIGPFTLDVAPDGSPDDDRFFGVKNAGGIESIKLTSLTSGSIEVDHVQFGDMGTLIATWDDGQAVQAAGVLDPALWVGLDIAGSGAPAVTTPDAETVVLSYAGLDPNEQLQINVAAYDLPFYPPDPIKVVGNQIQVVFSLATLTIDITSSSGGLLDPLSVVGFNPQPEPPDASLFAFSPPPAGEKEAMAIQAQLTGGSGSPGGTTVSLSLGVLDNAMSPLPISTVAAVTVPMLGPIGLGVLATAIGGIGVRAMRRRAAPVVVQ